MSELVKVRMPRLGESVTQGILVRWLVEPGASVTALDIIGEIETDKVNAEIPAPVTGTVRELLAREGDEIEVGAEIAAIEANDTRASPPEPQSVRSEEHTSELQSRF